MARAALLGARGNSGVILSQVVRGAAEELSSRPGELVDPVLVSAALARAADAAYSSVRDPAEGTMITVIREMALRVATELAHMEKTRLGPDATDEEQDAVLAEVLEQALDAAEASVERSPELLPVLREHGVVDAGGYGVVLLVAGVVAGLRGEARRASRGRPPRRAAATARRRATSTARYRYCTNFVVSGRGLDEARLRTRLEDIGDSVLVVGDKRDDAGPRAHRRARAGGRPVRRRRHGGALRRRRHARAAGAALGAAGGDGNGCRRPSASCAAWSP